MSTETGQDHAFAVESFPLINYVKTIAGFDFKLVLDVTESYLDVFDKFSSYSEYTWNRDEITSLPLSVYNRTQDRRLRERAMTLFEKLLDANISSAYSALNKWDEFRDWKVLL